MSADNTKLVLAKSGAELRADAAKRTQQLQGALQGEISGQLPLWADWQRGIPNEIARCSLFNSRNRSVKRDHFTDATMFSMGGTMVVYRGEELRQEDEIVWLEAMHLARKQPLDEWVEFVPSAFMKALGWKSQGASNYKRLRTILSRLQATALQFSSKRLGSGVSVSLIRRFEWKGLSKWRVWVEAEMRVLFPDDYYSRLIWQQRLDLPSGIASKLHSYYASHKQPLPIKVENIQALCGSTSAIQDFKKNLLEALEAMRSIGFLQRFWIDQNDVLHVHRSH